MPNEIFAADILVQEPKGQPKWIRLIPFKDTDSDTFFNPRYVKSPAKIIQVVKHKSLGFDCEP